MFKNYLKQILYKFGYQLTKINPARIQSSNPFMACGSLINSKNPIIFDVGMNHGQTLNKIKKVFPAAIIHGFEASKKCFFQLESDFGNNPSIFLNNIGVSDAKDELEFNEYSWDAMSSFLSRAYGEASITNRYKVNVDTIDNYCEKNNIGFINVLKSDTEGYELKVLKGAHKMLSEGKIQFVLIELFFDLNFFGQSSVGEIFSYLEKMNFSLVRFYDFSLTGKAFASKSDALFINNNFKHE